MLERFTKEKGLFFVLIIGVLVVFALVFWLFFAYGAKKIKILSPKGGEEWEIGKTYEIAWQSRGVEKIGIVLFHGEEPKWIAKDIPASQEKYEWKIYPGQEYGSGFWIVLVEYPWREDNKIDYSDFSFAITYPIFNSCEPLSTGQEWVYLPGNFPGLRKVFITEKTYKGNLDGLDGADNICQKEAEEKGYQGNWQAFLGGDADELTAVKRIENSERGKEGIFIYAEPALELERGDNCYRLLAKDFETFLSIFSELKIIIGERLEEDFLWGMENIWLGRFDEKSRKNCLPIAEVLGSPYFPLAQKYSFTVTCQNWTQDKKIVEVEDSSSFPNCYTSGGKSTDALALGALALGLEGEEKDAVYNVSVGKYCSESQNILCIEK